MKQKLILISKLVFRFFIISCLIIFLMNVFYLVKDNTIDDITLILSTVGLCFMIIIIVYNGLEYPLKNLFKLGDNAK